MDLTTLVLFLSYEARDIMSSETKILADAFRREKKMMVGVKKKKKKLER